jgi:hypothetical protein
LATKKIDQFVRANSYSYSSGLTLDLINSTNALLILAVRGRVARGNASLHDHASRFAPGAIVLGVMAFELLLNCLIVGAMDRTDAQIKEALDKRTIRKVDFLTSTFGTICTRRSDLELAIDVRNEIAHHFPRPGRAVENLPPWYAELERRGLFITSGKVDGDFDLGQKLGSFKLAYWVMRVVIDAVADLLRGSTHVVAAMNAFETSNFESLLNGVAAPDSLR